MAGIAISFCHADMEAKKVKYTFKVASKKAKDKTKSGRQETEGKGLTVAAGCDTVFWDGNDREVRFVSDSVSFAGYDKDATATREAFLLVNRSDATVTEYTVTIVYNDMKGRMLNSRELTRECNVPPKETRLLEIPTWDRQKSYYYYLSNEPRRVATPYQVEFIPRSFRIE